MTPMNSSSQHVTRPGSRSGRRPAGARSLAAGLLVAACAGGALAVVAPAGSVGAAPRACSSGGVGHTVGDGDTWFGIAAEAGVPMSSLLDANGASVDTTIHPGDQLCLPEGATPTGSGGSGGSGGGGCTVASARYTVATGDSWFAIARRAGTTMRELLDVNGADVDTTLRPDDRICLPQGARLTSAVNGVVPLAALPVQGPCWYGDTWRAPRGAGRTHEGVDLIVESGNYVYAVADGVLTRRAWDQPGSRSGNAWWLTGADGTYFFYAHLSDFAPGLKVGSRVSAGQIIGFVGSTGNSATAHLHFEVHPGGGDPINPYPSVRAAGGCRTGTGYAQPNGWVPE